jgi:hypothetical protein
LTTLLIEHHLLQNDGAVSHGRMGLGFGHEVVVVNDPDGAAEARGRPDKQEEADHHAVLEESAHLRDLRTARRGAHIR